MLDRLEARKPLALLVLLLTLLLSALCVSYGRSIRIDTRLRALLPDHTPSLVALRTVEQVMGASDQLTVAIECPDAPSTRRFGQALVAQMRDWPELEGLQFERDFTIFRDALLYWLELEELKDLREALRDGIARKVTQEARAGLDKDDIPLEEVRVDEDNWDEEYEEEPAPGQEPPAPKENGQAKQSLKQRIEQMRQKFLKDPRLRPAEAQALWPQAWSRQALEEADTPTQWPTKISVPVQSTDATIALITARVSRPPTDVAFVAELETRFAKTLAAVHQEIPESAAWKAQIVASYAISGDVDMIMVDLRNATTVSLLCVVAVLLLGFRTWKALVIIVAPVLVSMAITLALAALIYGELNVLTAFLFAVLFGMGVDFSVHLYMQRIKGEENHSWSDLLTRHWRPLLSTMLTTCGALLALCFAEFQAFKEFGLISAIGVSTCFLTAMVLVPALDRLLGTPTTSLAVGTKAQGPNAPRSWTVWLARAALGIVLLLCALGMRRLSFENNTRNLRAPPDPNASHDTIPYGRAQGDGRSGVPTVLYSTDAKALEKAVEKLKAQAQNPESWVKGVLSVQTLLPQQSGSKLEVIQDIHTLSGRVEGLDPGEQRAVQALHKLSATAPISAKDLPAWSRAPFTTKNGRWDNMAHAHLRFAAHDLNEVQAVVREIRALLAEDGVLAATTSFVFADLGQLITSDAKRLPLIALLAIALFLWLDLRRFGPALACLCTLGLGLALSIAILGLLDIRINFFNLAVLPAVVGLGIDASIHLWHCRGRPFGATERASLVAGATTCAAFGGLLAATHPGLQSMAHVGLIAIVSCVGVAFLLLATPLGRRSTSGQDPQRDASNRS